MRRLLVALFVVAAVVAAGDAEVEVRFADEARRDDRPWDVSRSVGDMLGNKR